MTANQIANASQRETVRHDYATEDIDRRKLDLDQQRIDLQKELNEIERSKLDFQNTWKQEDQRIQREYNDWYSKYMTASTKDKLAIESRLADIQADRQYWERYYQGIQSNLEQQRVKLQSQIEQWAQENKENNFAWQMEQSRNESVKLSLQRDQLDLERYKFDSGLALNYSQLTQNYLLQSTKMANDMSLGLKRLGYEYNMSNYKAAELNLSAEELRNKMSLTNSQKFQNYMNGISQLFKVGETVVGAGAQLYLMGHK